MLSFLLTFIDEESDRIFFTDIYKRYQNQMWKTANGVINDANLAEDAVQNAFFRVAKNIKTVRSLQAGAVRPYLLTAAKNAAIDLIKGNKEISVEKVFESNSKRSDSEIDTFEEFDFICFILDKMSPVYRDVLYLHLVSDISEREISNILNININATRQRISRGRKKFAELYNKEMEKIEAAKL